MKAVTFLFELLEPVLATQVQSGEPNSALAYQFIPGSMIRGALFGQYASNKTVDIEKDETARRLFLDGTVCYLNAYLAHPANQSRALPKPYSWFVTKDETKNPEASISDFALGSRSGEKYKSPSRGDFVWQTSSTVQLISPDMIGIVHNTSNDPNRKDEQNSQVYRYEAIAAGQLFAGAIISEDETLLKKAQALLETGKLNIGGSHRAGYGQVSVLSVSFEQRWEEYTPLFPVTPETWDDEPETEDAAAAVPQLAVLTCLSDLIWRDIRGHINADLVTPSGVKPDKAFYRLRPVGGFNRKWGLPLCQTWAVQAGSVFVFPASCHAELEQWVHKGIGERRAEGFGRIALDWHTHDTIPQGKSPTFVSSEPTTALSDKSRQIAQDMANRQLQAQIDRVLIRRIHELSHFKNLPKTAHLSRARLAARRAWYKRDLQELKKHFVIEKPDPSGKSEKLLRIDALSPTAIKQWENAKIHNQNFKKWILDEIKNSNQFTLVTELPKVAGVEADFDTLREQTLARLIEGVLRRAVKIAKAREEGGDDDSVE